VPVSSPRRDLATRTLLTTTPPRTRKRKVLLETPDPATVTDTAEPPTKKKATTKASSVQAKQAPALEKPALPATPNTSSPKSTRSMDSDDDFASVQSSEDAFMADDDSVGEAYGEFAAG
jgi:hypothetical protein